MKPYPAYKPSNLPWLGAIPAHWDVMSLKHFVSINKETLPETTHDDFEIEYHDISNVNFHGFIAAPQKYRFADAPSRARRILHTGDTIISTVRTYLKAIAYVEQCSSNLIASTGFAVLTPYKDTLARYIAYLVHSDIFIHQITAEAKGISYPAITANELGNLKLTITRSYEEQNAIVAFLDRKTEEIARFIACKRKLIALLHEEKAALIARAVTQGLNPDAPRKPSGTDWLGDVPAHWEVRRNSTVFREIVESGSDDDVLLSITMTDGIVLQSDTGRKDRSSVDKEAYKRIRKGDIGYNLMNAFMGSIGAARTDGILSPAYAVCRPFVPIEPEYYHFLFRTSLYLSEFDRESYGIMYERNRLYYDRFKAIYILYPPFPEQQQIVEYIHTEAARIDQIVRRTEREIELIQEYRATLISEAVTGKIDVRGM